MTPLPTLIAELEEALKAATLKPTDYEGYWACSDGHIWSTIPWRGMKTPRILATETNRYGYLRVHLKIGGRMKRVLVHRLVCNAFHGGKPTEAHQVRHLNGVKSDNRPDNLCWGTAAENAADRETHGNGRGAENGKRSAAKLIGNRPSNRLLTDEQAEEVRILRSEGMSFSRIAETVGCSKAVAIKIAHGKTYARAALTTHKEKSDV